MVEGVGGRANSCERPTPAQRVRGAEPSRPKLARIAREPYYQPIGDEVALFESAHRRRLPVLLKGPTGCGKTRFVEYMAWRLKRPLVTVACHDDLTTADLVGRYLIVGNETVWVDGPLTAAVRAGAICYLDEIVEARKDTTVVIHPLADSAPHPRRRQARRTGGRAPTTSCWWCPTTPATRAC
jgi:MoxR-like ATPase